jgi:predicted membrane protein
MWLICVEVLNPVEFECMSYFISYLWSYLISNLLFVILDLDRRISRNEGILGLGQLATKRWVSMWLICVEVLNPVEFECMSCFISYLWSYLISNLFEILDLDRRISRNEGIAGLGQLATKRWVSMWLICVEVLNPVKFECMSCFISYLWSYLISNLFVILDLDRRRSRNGGIVGLGQLATKRWVYFANNC